MKIIVKNSSLTFGKLNSTTVYAEMTQYRGAVTVNIPYDKCKVKIDCDDERLLISEYNIFYTNSEGLWGDGVDGYYNEKLSTNSGDYSTLLNYPKIEGDEYKIYIYNSSQPDSKRYNPPITLKITFVELV